MAEYVPKNICHKTPEGGVTTEPKNFLTNPPKVGEIGKGTTFGGPYEHLPDPFEHKKELLR